MRPTATRRRLGAALAALLLATLTVVSTTAAIADAGAARHIRAI